MTLAGAAAWILLIAAAQSSTNRPQDQPPPVLAPRVGVESAPARNLTLDDAIRLTLEQNNDVSIARLEAQAARQDIRAAEGVYDPQVVPTLSYQRTVTPSASAIGGGTNGRLQTNQFAGGVQLNGLAPWAGGRFTLDFTSSRLESSNQFARLNPQFPSSFGLSYVQPLFRGRSIDAERRQILLARRTADLTDSQLAQVLTEQVTLVEQAYWDLAFAARNLQVQVAALQQAEGQVSSNERQAQQGTLAPIDVVEAQTQVANFRQTVALAQQALTEAENRLKTLMLSDRAADAWNQALVPTTPAGLPVPELELDEAVRLALGRRPELTSLETARAQNEIEQRFFQDQAKPQVDLVASYSVAGLAGGALSTSGNPLGGSSASDAAILARLNELSERAGLMALESPPPSTGGTVPPFLVGSYGDSLSNLFARRFPTAVVQLQLDLPFANTTARANIARTQITSTQIARQRQQLEQTIEAEVRNALQAVRSDKARLDAAGSARRNASEQYESERRRFDSGLSTVFLVLERQTALVTAQARELRARADLNQAIAQLQRAVGGTLEAHGLQLDPSAVSAPAARGGNSRPGDR